MTLARHEVAFAVDVLVVHVQRSVSFQLGDQRPENDASSAVSCPDDAILLVVVKERFTAHLAVRRITDAPKNAPFIVELHVAKHT